MEDILTQLKKEMAAPHNRKLVQPPEGTYFQFKDHTDIMDGIADSICKFIVCNALPIPEN